MKEVSYSNRGNEVFRYPAGTVVLTQPRTGQGDISVSFTPDFVESYALSKAYGILIEQDDFHKLEPWIQACGNGSFL